MYVKGPPRAPHRMHHDPARAMKSRAPVTCPRSIFSPPHSPRSPETRYLSILSAYRSLDGRMSANIFDVLEDFDDFNSTFYRSSTSVDIDEQDIVDEEDHVPNNKAKKRRRRRFWHQRDSLARRNRLLMGKEGSRRRQRWDNSKFAGLQQLHRVAFTNMIRRSFHGSSFCCF